MKMRDAEAGTIDGMDLQNKMAMLMVLEALSWVWRCGKGHTKWVETNKRLVMFFRCDEQHLGEEPFAVDKQETSLKEQ